MEVEIDGRVEAIWLEPKAENVFVFEKTEAPRLVHFDFESTWIKEVKFEKTLDEWLFQIENDADLTGKRLAMGELAKLAQDEKATTAAQKTQIEAAFRAVVLGKSYWRLRYSAMLALQNLVAKTSHTLLDEATISMLLEVIKNEKSCNRTAASICVF